MKKDVAQITIITQGEDAFNVQVKLPTVDVKNLSFPIQDNKAEMIAKLMCDFMKRELMTPEGKLISLRAIQEKHIYALKQATRVKFKHEN